MWQQHFDAGHRLRDLLTGLAIVLIVILTAALAAPYFIDWNGQRGFLEARLSRALGQRVAIGGAIDLKLLPTPYLSLRRTTIGNDDGPVTVAIRTLDLELAVAPLLHGAFDIVEARLGEPTIRVTLGRDRTLPALPAAPAFGADVAFDRIDVADGTLAVADPLSDHTYVFEHLDVSAEAPALAGPFKATGTSGAANARTPFRLSTSVARDGRLKLRFNAGETAEHPGLDLDGTLALREAGHRALSASFEGTLALTGRTSLGGAPVPWRLSGPLKADPRGATLSGGELRLGREDAGLTLQADVQGDLGENPNLALTLAAKRLDIDRLSGAPVDAIRPTPPQLPSLAGLRDAVARVMPPIPTTADVAIGAATWGGDTLSAVAAHWSDDGRGRQALRLAGDGPGSSHLAIDGTLPPAGFAGTVDLAASNVPVALDWLARIDRAAGHGAGDLPFRSAGIGGRVATGSAGVEASALTLKLEQSTLTGSGRLAFADGSAPTRIALDLRAKTFDLGALPPLATLRAAAAPYDVDLTLDAEAVALRGDGALDAGPVSVALTKAGGTVTLTSLKAKDLGGATIDARGHLDPRGASVTAAVEATRLGEVAALVRRLVPGAATDALAARAPALAPAKLTIDLALVGGTDGVLEPRHLTIAGRAGGTAVTATLAPSGGDGDAHGNVVLDATLDAPEGGTLLRQLGLATLPLGQIGGSRVTLHARGPSGRSLDTTVHATFGATTLDVTGRFDPLADARADHGDGDVHLTSPDLGPVLRSLALAVPDVADRMPADVGGHLAFDRTGVTVAGVMGTVGGVAAKGDLRWRNGTGDTPGLTGTLNLDHLRVSTLLALMLGPAKPAANGARFSSEGFSGGLVDPPRAALALRIANLALTDGLVATDAGLDLGVAPGVVTLRGVTATLAGGRVSGTISLRRGDGDATLEGRLALDKTRLAVPGANALVSGTLDMAGGGSSASALVASLAGSGTARASGLSIPHADPAALPKVFADVEADTLAVDEASIVRALEDGSAGPISLGDRRFDLSLVGGILRIAPVRTTNGQDASNQGGSDQVASSQVASNQVASNQVAGTFEATLDLRTSRLDEHVRETLLVLPPNWSGAAPMVVFTLAGPIEDPRRSIDVGGLIDAVATRALARESARIEAYETDIRERAFFAERLRSEDRREKDRLKLEDDARRTEAEREAARLDRLRKEDAARAAAARSEQGITEAIQARAAAAKAAREKAIQGKGDGPPAPTGDERPGQDDVDGGRDRSNAAPDGLDDPTATNRQGSPARGRAM